MKRKTKHHIVKRETKHLTINFSSVIHYWLIIHNYRRRAHTLNWLQPVPNAESVYRIKLQEDNTILNAAPVYIALLSPFLTLHNHVKIIKIMVSCLTLHGTNRGLKRWRNARHMRPDISRPMSAARRNPSPARLADLTWDRRSAECDAWGRGRIAARPLRGLADLPIPRRGLPAMRSKKVIKESYQTGLKI